MFCYLILLFSISVSGASVLNRIEQTRKDFRPTRDIADGDEGTEGQEVLSRGIRDLLYWNRVLNSLKGNYCNFFERNFRIRRDSIFEGFEKNLKLEHIIKNYFRI